VPELFGVLERYRASISGSIRPTTVVAILLLYGAADIFTDLPIRASSGKLSRGEFVETELELAPPVRTMPGGYRNLNFL